MFRETSEAAGKRCSDYQLDWEFRKICRKPVVDINLSNLRLDWIVTRFFLNFFAVIILGWLLLERETRAAY